MAYKPALDMTLRLIASYGSSNALQMRRLKGLSTQPKREHRPSVRRPKGNLSARLKTARKREYHEGSKAQKAI